LSQVLMASLLELDVLGRPSGQVQLRYRVTCCVILLKIAFQHAIIS
jgi:hypothetical protein